MPASEEYVLSFVGALLQVASPTLSNWLWRLRYGKVPTDSSHAVWRDQAIERVRIS